MNVIDLVTEKLSTENYAIQTIVYHFAKQIGIVQAKTKTFYGVLSNREYIIRWFDLNGKMWGTVYGSERDAQKTLIIRITHLALDGKAVKCK